ncbi:hypothetical protein SCLCIDRAFT_132925, partial [Scleroderma citrinum Foug A]
LTQTGYSDLEKIIILAVPPGPFFGALGGKSVILALVKPWDMDGKVASKENVYFKDRRAMIIMDVRSLKAIVGLVKTRGRWGIIDRVPGAATMTFADHITAGAGEQVQDELSNNDFIL